LFRLGLTGGSGAGKGYISDIFAKHGIYSLDTDLVSREVNSYGQPCYFDLVDFFGTDILNDDKTINRKLLAKKAFSDDAKYKVLNEISHHYILAYCRDWLSAREKEGCLAAIIDAPLLFESGFDSECDYIISVIAMRSVRIKRICERDGISRDDAELRLSRQKPDDFYTSKSDFVIYNDDDTDLDAAVKKIIARLEEIKDQK